MVSQIKPSEFDAFALLQSLGNYLKTEIEISHGTVERKVKADGKQKIIQDEGHNIKVTVSNTAPTEPSWPVIVFTGVGLAVRIRNKEILLRRMRKEERLKVDLTNAPQGESWNLFQPRIDNSSPFPPLTSDERKRNYFLFPGQSITYEMGILSRECPDINDMHLQVEGTISRRHLLHYVKELTLSPC